MRINRLPLTPTYNPTVPLTSFTPFIVLLSNSSLYTIVILLLIPHTQYEKRLTDYNFGTLVRKDADRGYAEDNSILVTRVQFFAIEVGYISCFSFFLSTVLLSILLFPYPSSPSPSSPHPVLHIAYAIIRPPYVLSPLP